MMEKINKSAEVILLDDLAARMSQGLHEYRIPLHMHESVMWYVLFGIPPGGFTQAVFRGDLFDAVDKADSYNQQALVNWAKWIYNFAPMGARNPDNWISVKGLVGSYGLPEDQLNLFKEKWI